MPLLLAITFNKRVERYEPLLKWGGFFCYIWQKKYSFTLSFHDLRILIIAYFYPPDNNGGVQRPLAFANYLKRLQHQVKVFTHGNKNENDESVFRVFDINQSNWWNVILHTLFRSIFRILSIFGIHTFYYSVWLFFSKRNVIKKINEFKPDVIIATYPPIECLLLMEYISDRIDIPFVLDFRDPLVFETAEFASIKRFPALMSKYIALEKKLVDKASFSLVISPAMEEYMRMTYTNKRIELLPNGFSKEDLKAIEANVGKFNLLDNCFDANKLSILYTGTVGYYDKDRNLDAFFETVREINNKSSFKGKLEVLFFGDSTEDDFSGVEDLIINKVIKVFPKVSREESLYLQKKADILLLITGETRRSIATGKVFEYIFSGKHILALAQNNYAEQIVKETRTGFCCSAKNKEAMSSVLVQWLKLFIENKLILLPNYEEIEKYDRGFQVQKLNLLLRKIADEGI
jgi:glycosyltransferase involved in cell wall biosynthesis